MIVVIVLALAWGWTLGVASALWWWDRARSGVARCDIDWSERSGSSHQLDAHRGASDTPARVYDFTRRSRDRQGDGSPFAS